MKAIAFLTHLAVLEKKINPQNPRRLPPVGLFGLEPSARMHDLIARLKQISAEGKNIVGFASAEIDWLLGKALSMEICRADACSFNPLARKFPDGQAADQCAWTQFKRMNDYPPQ